MNAPLRTLTSRDKFPCWQNGEKCTVRRIGCHAFCEKYISAKAVNDERKALERYKRSRLTDVNTFKATQAAKSTNTKLKER